MAALMFVDLLGTRTAWREKGLREVQLRFRRFRELLGLSLSAFQTDLPREFLGADIESDSAAILVQSEIGAARLGIKLFRDFFLAGASPEERYWLRGVIVPADVAAAGELRRRVLDGPIIDTAYHAGLLEAIAIEKSGFRGMRLLVQSDLFTGRARYLLQEQTAPGAPTIYLIRRLEHSFLPGSVRESVEEVLWMLSPYADFEWLQRKMDQKLRYAASSDEELFHAAATQVVFNECKSIVASARPADKARVIALPGPAS